MKLKIAIIDDNRTYAEKIKANLEKYYKDKLEVWNYSDISDVAGIRSADLFITAESRLNDVAEAYGAMHTIAVFCENSSIESIHGYPAICRYQSVDDYYASISSLVAASEKRTYFKSATNDTITVLFTSAAGGCGTSTLAYSFCISKAAEGKKVFYLDLNRCSGQDMFAEPKEESEFGKVLFALKSNNNLTLRLRGLTKCMENEIYGFSAAANYMDMCEFFEEDAIRLAELIGQTDEYDYLVIDWSSYIGDAIFTLMGQSDKVFLVSENNTAAIKTKRFLDAISMHQRAFGSDIMSKTAIVINDRDNKTARIVNGTQFANMVSGINAVARRVSDKMSGLLIWDRV